MGNRQGSGCEALVRPCIPSEHVVSDRRRIVAALRAKAASTTFPAEAESLRSKADAMEGKLRAGERSHQPLTRPPANASPFIDFARTYTGPSWAGVQIDMRITGGRFFYQPTESPDDRKPGEERPGEGWMTVTDVHGNSHRERIW